VGGEVEGGEVFRVAKRALTVKVSLSGGMDILMG
jgi:hypothetical protein